MGLLDCKQLKKINLREFGMDLSKKGECTFQTMSS